jgi:ribosome biogenesis protein ERB1
MAVKDAGRKSTKRKQVEEEDVAQPEELPSNGGLEMLSDEEDGDASSDDGHVDEFPEIVNESSSEESDYEEDEEDDEGDEDEEDSEENDEASDADSDDSLHVFPKAKTIISDITQQPKIVYPEIEPNYDSDSSTEDVSKCTLTSM